MSDTGISDNMDATPESVVLHPTKQDDVASCSATEETESTNWEVIDDEIDQIIEGIEDAPAVAGAGEERAEGGQTVQVEVGAAVNVTGMDRLLQRHRNEIMFELRKLKFGDRPVTGREDRRQAVEALVNRCVVQPSTRLARSRFDSLSDRRPAPSGAEPQRPEEIMIEVNALVERRPVSSILQSLSFRRSIENSLRGVLGSLQRDLRSRVTPPQTTGVNSERPESRNDRGVNPATADTPALATNNFVSTEHVTEIVSSLDNHAEANAFNVVREETDGLEFQRNLHGSWPVQEQPYSTPQRRPALPDQPPVVGTQRASEWLRGTVPPFLNNDNNNNNNNSVERELNQFQFMHEMQRENLIMDISELIQRHLVTSALEGDFRHVLERRMRNRLNESGIDGSRVQEQLQQLPRGRPRPRNDFMDLGISTGQGAQGGALSDPLDDVSVISATAAVALPQAYTQSTAAMNREMQVLRTQVKELKNMMQLSFDLQLDIQRAIRQEVAAAVSSTLGLAATGADNSVDSSHGPTVREALRRRSRRGAQESESQCLICLDKPVDTALYQCGHMCLCYGCGMQLRQQGAHCPVCRAPIRDIIKTYKN